METERLLLPEETAAQMRLSIGTLAKWRVLGRGPRFRKLGRRVVYATSDIREWLESAGRRSTSEHDTLTAA